VALGPNAAKRKRRHGKGYFCSIYEKYLKGHNFFFLEKKKIKTIANQAKTMQNMNRENKTGCTE